MKSFSVLGCNVDPLHRVVTDADGRSTRLEPKASDLLLFLVGHAGEVFSVDRLIESVWDGRFVTGDVVMVAVSALRQAFGDDARQPRFIETVRGRGYRWIAPFDRERATAARPSRSRLLAASLALVLVAGGCAWFLLRRPAPMPSMNAAAAVVRAQARGLFFSDRRTIADMNKAVEEFRHAIAIDARFAEPHAALAEATVRLMEMTNEVRPDREAEARREAARALELDPNLSLGHAAQASVAFVLDRDMANAEQSFRRAIAIDPSIPSVRRRFAYLLAANGRFGEAVAHARSASELAPTSSSTFADLGWIEFLAGDRDRAERDIREAIRLDPGSASAILSLASCFDFEGRPVEAWAEYRRGLPLIGVPPSFVQQADAAYAAKGLHGVYEFWAASAARPERHLPRFLAAFWAARAGNSGEAMAMLRQSVERREPASIWIGVHPAFASLRGDEAFVALARQAGVKVVATSPPHIAAIH
jgi:DNA-binding winged helix-turn-helix (wHTH) protein/Tfp pilus assembly protein PilF